jgi:hypothetical protein
MDSTKPNLPTTIKVAYMCVMGCPIIGTVLILAGFSDEIMSALVIGVIMIYIGVIALWVGTFAYLHHIWKGMHLSFDYSKELIKKIDELEIKLTNQNKSIYDKIEKTK